MLLIGLPNLQVVTFEFKLVRFQTKLKNAISNEACFDDRKITCIQSFILILVDSRHFYFLLTGKYLGDCKLGRFLLSYSTVNFRKD